jgi:hypothetical protein
MSIHNDHVKSRLKEAKGTIQKNRGLGCTELGYVSRRASNRVSSFVILPLKN